METTLRSNDRSGGFYSTLSKRFLLLLSFLLMGTMAFASHYRFGTISWERDPANPQKVIFKVKQAWRLNSFGTIPNIGDTKNTGVLYFGDGGSSSIVLTITATDNPGNAYDGWFFGEATITHTYSGNGPFLAYYQSCCRIGYPLQNNSGGSFRNEVNVDLSKANSGSPVATVAPIVNVPVGLTAAQFSIPATDPDLNATLTYSYASSSEVIGSDPSGYTLNSNGTATFNTVGKTIGNLYNVRAKITDNHGAKTIVDFFLKIVGQSNPPQFDYGVTPANNTVFQVSPGQNLSFNVKATDSDPGDKVVLSVVGAPATAGFTPSLPNAPANPSMSAFSWTPTSGNLGTYVMQFTATDSVGVQATTSIIAIVSLKPVFDFPPTPSQGGAHVMLAPGQAFSGTIQASDPESGDLVKLVSSRYQVNYGAWSNGVVPGMTLSSPLPSAPGNPTSVGLSWTPSASDFGHNHVEFTAEDTLGQQAVHTVKFMVNTPSTINSTAVTCVNPGQQYTYNLTSGDPDIPYGDSVYFALIQGPAWMSLSNNNGNGTATLSGMAPANYAGGDQIEILVQDKYHNHGNMPAGATQMFTLSLCNNNPPPPPPAGQCAADFVLDYNPVGNIDATRTDSSQALGIPEDDDTFNFVTLGFGGSLTLGFNPPALNGPGNDLRVYETSFGSQTCQKYPETARIWATIDFVTWVDLGTVCLDGEVDLGILPYANAIRIVDETPVPSPSRDGYDVDGVLCLNGRRTVQQCVAQCEPDSVLYVSQGTRKDGNAVDANRSIPGRATGTPEDDDTYNFFTLGTGGTITLFYSQGCLYDQQGYDFRVVETSFGDPACRRYPESAHIEVSMDDVTYYSIDSICLDGMVDFSGTGLAYIKYIRITDVSKLFGGDAMDYYDVDGVECINNAGALRTAPKDPSNGIYIEDEYMQMYPNPVNNGQSVTIRVESIDANPIKVDIYNTMGALVYSVEGDALVHEQIDISNYTPGIYIVKMDVDGVVRTKKLIVQ